ncbi:zinc finger protein MSN2-like isoform X13 [Pomacea canaliculata]|uniref:zinc finger protein MSN2-like isoform X13 n=1 Tax=Pomacea canaliculata TaxID=400727 RepID=UPI000D73CBE4|nr:zinc finger protein MSN2-like isoform X13 [Pomacea canaliculata]
MDQESSSKFIGSLTKFLQSLCNGYVDFEDGVELIGHIYLSVDTGKKIDYILNEKVCKSDNSVTFISNSFHAQPADKVKTALGKKSEDKSDGGIRKDDDILSESADSLPRTSNVGPNPGRSVSSLRPGITSQNRGLKRPGSPLISRKASSPPQRRPLTPPSQRRSHLQPAKVSLGSPASSKNIPSSPSSSSQDNIPSPSSKLKTRNDNITSIQTVQIPTDGGDADKDSQVQPTLLPVVQVPDLSSFLGSASSEGQDVSQEHGLATSDDTKPDTDITFIKEEFIPGASSCAQAGTGGQPSGRSMEEQLQDSESPSGLYPVMLHQNTAAFSNTGSGFPTGFPQLGNATATSSRAGYNQSVPSTSASQASADMFSNSVPGTSSQDSSSGDPAVNPLLLVQKMLAPYGSISENLSSDEAGKETSWTRRKKNFSCSFCGKAFTVSRDCIGHVNAVHLNLKPYVCEKCSSSFANSKTLHGHKKLCSGTNNKYN